MKQPLAHSRWSISSGSKQLDGWHGRAGTVRGHLLRRHLLHRLDFTEVSPAPSLRPAPASERASSCCVRPEQERTAHPADLPPPAIPAPRGSPRGPVSAAGCLGTASWCCCPGPAVRLPDTRSPHRCSVVLSIVPLASQYSHVSSCPGRFPAETPTRTLGK